MKKLCAIISGGQSDDLAGIRDADFIIACDRGYAYAKEAGIRPDLIRFSVGIENADDIIADIEQALNA